MKLMILSVVFMLTAAQPLLAARRFSDLDGVSENGNSAAEELRLLREDLKAQRRQDALDRKVEAVDSGEEPFSLLTEKEQIYYLKKKHRV